jgi:alkylation response protein AidB-like acyl-CoA dehydrogenase
MSITGIFNSHLIMAAAVERFGTVQQKAKWLPKFASGEIRGGLALTEPNAGTDLQALRTVAKKDANGDYILNGEGNMPAFSDLSDQEIADVLAYIHDGLIQ